MQSPQFEITGGHPALDFANTVEYRPTEHQEMLHAYNDLVEWAKQAGAIGEAEARELRRQAARHPARAEAVLRRARQWRETIYRVFSAVATGQAPAARDLEALNAALRDALPHLRVERARQGYAWEWKRDEDALERVLWPVVRAAGELLTSGDLGSVRECASDSCAWLFLDRSRNHSRRWCDMKVCGNRAKVRRFRERAG